MSEKSLDLDYFRSLLLNEQVKLMGISETGDEAASVVELDQACVGRLSRMDAMRAQAMSQEAKRRREIQLQKIKRALARIDSDDYGFCLSCGELISEKRLQIDPANSLCIECAE